MAKITFEDGQGFVKVFKLSDDNEIRNVRIISMFEGMGHSNLKYDEKMQLIGKKFHLSPERIRNIIQESKHT